MARVLVVEDNPANLELLRYILEKFNHSAACAADGQAGLVQARAEMPELILCDLQMPKLDGYEFLRQVRLDPALRDVVVVAVTAYSMPGDREQALQAGFDGYLTKPIDPATIVTVVEAFLAAGRRA
jgi:two-component system, cell cycle response regulator DivK